MTFKKIGLSPRPEYIYYWYRQTGRILTHQNVEQFSSKGIIIANTTINLKWSPNRRDKHPMILNFHSTLANNNLISFTLSLHGNSILSDKTYRCVEIGHYSDDQESECRVQLGYVQLWQGIPFRGGDVCKIKVVGDKFELDLASGKKDIYQPDLLAKNVTPFSFAFECKSSENPSAVFKGYFLKNTSKIPTLD